MIIKSLSKKFRHCGVFYEQIKRTGDIALYSLRYGEALPIIGYDVVRVQSSTGEQLNGLLSSRRGAKIEDYAPDDTFERYPPSPAWGKSGWSFSTLPPARKKFFELVSGVTSPNEPFFTVGKV